MTDRAQIYAVSLKDYNPTPEPPVLYTETVYMVDVSERTHLCEATPSYYLVPLYVNVTCAEGTSDAERENAEMNGWGEAGDPIYRHCSAIDDIISKAEPGKVYAADHSKDEKDATSEEIFEFWREHWQSNYPL